MAIRHTAVSYYGLNYTEHAEKDFIEMKDHGCDTVILAITEFDMDFRFPNINNIVRTAHKVGLRCIADPWGIGKYFGGEQVSLFLQNNIHHRQVSAYTGEILNAACFNTRFQRLFWRSLSETGEGNGDRRIFLGRTALRLFQIIRETVFGKCVFDNEILYHVDNQFVQMYFKNGVKASLKMVYGNEPGRRLAFYGTYGEIIMDERTDEIEVMVFGKEKEIISINSLTEDGNAHGGGDGALMAELYPILIGEQKSRTPLKESIESHLMGIAAEESRKNGGVLVKVHGQTE